MGATKSPKPVFEPTLGGSVMRFSLSVDHFEQSTAESVAGQFRIDAVPES